MTRVRALLSTVLLLTLALVGAVPLAGCDNGGLPPLVEVTEVSPRSLEVGDRLEIRGAGFPQGRTARLTFRGTMFRPGRAEMRGASIEADGLVTSSDRIEVVVTDALEEAFCGRGDRATHVTMNAELEVAFSSSVPGAPPLAGVMRGLTLDVVPSSVRASVLEARAKEGTRVLSYLGVTPGPASPRGLPIEKLEPGSPGERSGFQVGDVIVAVDGLHVREVGDVAPASSRSASITIRHGESGSEETKTLPMVGYASERITIEYAPALLVVGLALALLVLLVLPAPITASELELRIARRLRHARARTLVLAVVGAGPRAIASVLVSILVGTFALGPHVVAPDLDGAVLLVASLALLVASRVAAAKGVMASLRAAADAAMFALLLTATMAATVVHGGAFRLAEIAKAQGGLPWEFAAARQPAMFVLALAYLGALTAMIRARDDSPLLSDARLDELAVAKPAPDFQGARMLERLGLVVGCALAVAVFFGGWQLPGAPEGERLAREIASALVFVAKTWALTAALLGLSSVATPWSLREARSFALRRLLPALVVAAALVFGFRKLAPSETLELAAGATVVTAGVLLAFRTGLRIKTAISRPEPHASPFI
ncbi:MAG: PDZ domain-containing protein [Deltaproteobacteria bacterium]|nr:PDZ domain-containing protein [Deltaproteobacteria bacterium]